ncbi:histidinol-phosphate transaminase [Legionella parisiensis]|uniref:Histidinol-phosphate aminotransferase n=1 Tax=Legionella parisiensis TaxID=45071 RepID=A0A1E5JRU4_9GAMM|nr:histidinol-phosphate transaminase [Legionella parisiensis]KTD41039.1 Histidinol-phosphate aminotransferase (Imidazole acetol-phosphate transaminase) [Legionella parisiensis]OEH47256.1 Histidinol-phosphate aminotransferase [Legionella parisiensis]STX76668.1 Histidinol-phosphate aminotransferase (Imidazole acetol-phosphate transaminase) [Legionella parisiensis]
MSVLNLIRPELLDNQPYSVGSVPMRHRLHANELPWSALSTNISLNFYPEKYLQDQLQEHLAKYYQVEEKQIVLTRGSDDGIDLITRLFLSAGQDACMQCPPTFSMYSFYTYLQHAQLIECPLDAQNNFQLSLDEIRSTWKNNCKLIFLCNPNNPTGSLIELDFIATLCDEYKNRSVIVVDEAYIEFAQTQSATCLISQFDNLIVLRTLSKAYGLANLRLGIIIAQENVIRALNKIMPPFPLSSVVIDLALRALEKNEWFLQAINTIKESRANLIKELQLCPVIKKVYPTETNFILIKTEYTYELVSWLANQGIVIKSYSPNSSLHDHLRITVGDEPQNQLLLRALSSFQNNVSGY